MERGDPITFVYRPLPDSNTPEQAIKFDDLIDAWDFADNLMKLCKKKGIMGMLKRNRAERRK